MDRRCVDCCNEKEDLQEYGGLMLRVNPARFCRECLEKRKWEAEAGKEPRPLGIPADIPTAVWVDLPDVTVRSKPHAGKGEIIVKARFRKPTVPDFSDNDGGEVRDKLPEVPNWLPAGILFLETPSIRRNLEGAALREVKSALRRSFEPNAEVL